MLNRFLYIALALALAAVCIFDPIFPANLFRMVGQPLLALLSLITLETWLVGGFLVLAGAAVFLEWPRERK
jgi:hypothetical protein